MLFCIYVVGVDIVVVAIVAAARVDVLVVVVFVLRPLLKQRVLYWTPSAVQ